MAVCQSVREAVNSWGTLRGRASACLDRESEAERAGVPGGAFLSGVLGRPCWRMLWRACVIASGVDACWPLKVRSGVFSEKVGKNEHDERASQPPLLVASGAEAVRNVHP